MSLQNITKTAFENRVDISPSTVIPEVKEAVLGAIRQLDSDKLRVTERLNVGEWEINEQVEKAVLLSFRIQDNEVLNNGVNKYFDKMPTEFADWPEGEFRVVGFHTVPGAVARHGSSVTKNVALISFYVNIGAYVNKGAMVGTWATVGSRVQVDKNVHLSDGAGIGGVLEPLQASPTIIEDNYFIGARSEIVEGMIVEEGSVVSAGVFIGQSTKILGRITGETYQGRIPASSVVVSGSISSEDNSHSLCCTVIIKHMNAQTHARTSVNELLRGI